MPTITSAGSSDDFFITVSGFALGALPARMHWDAFHAGGCSKRRHALNVCIPRLCPCLSRCRLLCLRFPLLFCGVEVKVTSNSTSSFFSFFFNHPSPSVLSPLPFELVPGGQILGEVKGLCELMLRQAYSDCRINYCTENSTRNSGCLCEAELSTSFDGRSCRESYE